MEALDFKKAFKYPFNRPRGLLNAFWFIIPLVLVVALSSVLYQTTTLTNPIANAMLVILSSVLIAIPLFAIGGYVVRIVNEFVEGKYEKTPLFRFNEDMRLGFFMFLKSIPFAIAYWLVLAVATGLSEGFGTVVSLILGIFVVPLLTVNFIRKQTIESYFEIDIIRILNDQFGEYLIAYLKQFALGLVFGLLVLVIVGIPAALFTQSIFIANFYGRFIEKGKISRKASSKAVRKPARKSAVPAKKSTASVAKKPASRKTSATAKKRSSSAANRKPAVRRTAKKK